MAQRTLFGTLAPTKKRLPFASPKTKYEEFVNAFVGKRDVGRKLEDAVKAANAAWREEYKSDPEKLVSFLAKAHEEKAAAEAKKLDFGFVRLSPAAGEGSSASHGISARERDQFEKRVQSSSSTLSSRGSPGGVRLTRATPASDDRATASEEAARCWFDTVAVSWLCGHLDVSENALLTEDVISVDAFITGLQRCAHTLAELVKLKGTYTSLLQRGAYHSSKLADEMAR